MGWIQSFLIFSDGIAFRDIHPVVRESTLLDREFELHYESLIPFLFL